ncbi:MAG: SMI1/KNR4 family protein [Alphaproteobacteria bacterium]|nr:SMI1/KNR4 family protein [Alphaproteobacteria bacterium]MCB9694549.1 SMI1/KNR4 family protein [Alphaproteobacteria bacterium]
MQIEERGKPVSEEVIRDVETRLGHRFPSDYRDFLRANNGGFPVPDSFAFADGRPGSKVQFFFGFGGKVRTARLDYAIATFKERLPPGLIPIASDPFGNLICIGLCGSPWEERVVFWDHERESDEGEPARTDNLTPIADSFTAFLHSLSDL